MAMNFKKLLQEEREKAKLRQSNSLQVNLTHNESNHAMNSPQSDENLSNKIHDRIISFNVGNNFQLENYRLKTDLPCLYYIPDIISPEDEEWLVETIEELGNDHKKWHHLRSRRLQQWGNFPTDAKTPHHETISLPVWLEGIVDRLMEYAMFPPAGRPDNVLINQYEAHQGVLHHTDGPAYHNRVAILSLESTCVMTFRRKLHTAEIGVVRSEGETSAVLRPRSLFLFAENYYDFHLHGICPEQEVVEVGGDCVNSHSAGVVPGETIGRTRRTSLTLRRIKS